MWKSSSLCAFSLLAAAAWCSQCSAECHQSRASGLRMLVHTQRNATGHRNVKVLLETRAAPGGAADLGSVETTQNVYLCDGMEFVSTTSTFRAPPVRLQPPGYEIFPGLGYYKFHTKAVPWDEAYQTCVSEGSHLLVLNSEAESHVLRQFLGRKANIDGTTWPNWAWAGFHDRGLEGTYLTVHGGALTDTGYAKWHPGQPDNKPWGTEPDQDCGSYNKDALLNDLPCLGKLPFICEQPL